MDVKMIGAIIGDIIGSTYEFIDNVKDKNLVINKNLKEIYKRINFCNK